MQLRSIILLLLAGLMGPVLRAAEETTTFRVIGFSHPEREADFRQVMRSLPELVLVKLDIEKAEVTFRYDMAKLLPKASPDQPVPPEKVLEELEKRIGNASTRTFSLTLKTVPSAAPTKVDIPVGLLDCKGCRYGVYLAVAKIEGVDRASVTGEGVLTVWIDATKTNREVLVDALKKARIDLP